LLGLEALLRWEHPTKELQFPGAISELFDDADLGSVLGERMVDRVLDDMSNWTKNGVRFGRVFVNASAIELRNSGYAEAIIGRLAKAGVDPACFGIEVTETGFFNSKTEGLLHELKTLNAAGISIVLDDFGTGFGSLTHLLHFPISGIKIDCSFVSRMDTEPHARGVINAMIALAKNLGLDLVAEGIETRDQLTFFRNAGCPAIQGYLFSKPVPAENIPGLSKSLPVKFQKIMGSPEALQKKRRR
jgi:EAL domain-containing protein (putative c-di-GMP-specific phosphodiesterase class I)